MTVDAQVTAPRAPGSPGTVGRPRTTAADVILATLQASGVRRIHGLPGDSLNGLTEAPRRDRGVTWQHVRHEEAAALAAAGEAAVTGELTVCAASCGPGNLHPPSSSPTSGPRRTPEATKARKGTTMNARVLPVLATCLVAALAGCGFGGDEAAGDQPSLVVGSANFPENALLAEIYAGALRDEGLEVSTELNVGSRETLLPAMERGDITVLPEYTGALLSYLSKGAAEATDTAGQVKELATALPDELVLLEPSEAQDQETITCTAEVAEEHGLTSIADLAPVSRELVFGGPPELPSREGFGLKGLKELYDVEFKTFRPLDVSGPLTVSALKEGKVDCANLFSTQSAIEVNGFVSLTDPKGLVESEAVVPLVARDAATQDVTDALNAVSASLTTEALKAMVKRVEVDKDDPRAVAEDFLSEFQAVR